MLRAVHFHRDGEYIYLRRWLEKHASRFGFYLVYNDDSKRKGFKYEPWHYSYKPLSQPYLQSYRNLNLKEILQNEKLSGHSQFTEALLNTYLNENILDINLELL